MVREVQQVCVLGDRNVRVAEFDLYVGWLGWGYNNFGSFGGNKKFYQHDTPIS